MVRRAWLHLGTALLLLGFCVLVALPNTSLRPGFAAQKMCKASSNSSGKNPPSHHNGSSKGCAALFPRMTLEQVAEGAQQPGGLRPYLFGGRLPQPGQQGSRGAQNVQCSDCTQQREWWADLCSFKYSHFHVTAGGDRWATVHVCSDDVQRQMVRSWVERGYTAPLTMTPCDLWSHLSGHTLFVMGDSISQDLMLALVCFLFDMRAGPVVAKENAPAPWLQHQITDDTKVLEDLPPGVRGNSGCVHFVEDTRICFLRTDKGQDFHGAVLPWLLRHKLATRNDRIIGNFGLHHGSKEYTEVLGNFTRWYQEHEQQLPRFFWQQTLQQHFSSQGGEYPGGKPPFKCSALEGYSVQGDGQLVLQAGQEDKSKLLEGGWRNALANSFISAAGIPIIGSFNETVAMWGAHRDNGSGFECTHYCHPSAPQSSVASLLQALQAAKEKERTQAATGDR